MGKTQPLDETTFVVVDIETTGGSPGQHALLEIGAVKVLGGQIVDRFESLVNPKQDIPPFIRGLTGITLAMVESAPTTDQVMPALWDFLGDGVFVAHNATFDFRFLSALTKTLLGQELDNPQLCTLRLARKLLPRLRKKNLGAVAEHLDIPITNRHRAMGDAEATALILLEFLKPLQADGVTTLAKLLTFQKSGGKRYGDLKIPFPQSRLETFPLDPGVYLMRNERGDILYIGKAKNLRKRLQSYFTNLYRQPGKVQELMHQVMDIETRVLGSELEALLEESHLIKHHQPYFNRQIKNFRSFPFLKVTVQDLFPQLEVTTQLDQEGALYFGPYQRKTHLNAMVDSLSEVFRLRSCTNDQFKKHQWLQSPCMAAEIGTCSAPCVGQVTPTQYHTQVAEIVDFLEGRVSDVTQRLIVQRDHYSQNMLFEKAKQIQDRLLELLKLQANTQYLAQAVHQNHLLLALPDRDPPRSRLLYVYKGRPLYKQTFDPMTDSMESIMERVLLLQQMLAATVEDKREVIPQSELEEIRIIAHWLRREEPDPHTRVWDLTLPYPQLAQEIHQHFSHSV